MSTSKIFIHPITLRSTNDSTSAFDTNSSLAAFGGLAVAKSGYFGGKLSSIGFDAGSEEITNVSDPIASTSAATRNYVDTRISTSISPQAIDNFSIELYGTFPKIRVSSMGIGTGLLGGSGTAVSINPIQSLTSLSLTGTADANSPTTGTLQLPGGGMGLAKSMYIGGDILFSNDIQLSTETGGNFNAFQVRNVDPINVETRLTVSNTVAAASYTNRFRLYSLGNGDATNQEMLEVTASSAGATLHWQTIGTGMARPLSIYDGAINVSAGGTGVAINAGLTNSFATMAAAPSFTCTGTSGGTLASFLAPSLIADSTVSARLGASATSYNSGEIRFNYVSDTSISNNLAFGIYGFPGDIFQLDASGNATFPFGTVAVNNTTDAASSTTGSLQVSGGILCQKSLFVSGSLATLYNSRYVADQVNSLTFLHGTNSGAHIDSYYSGSDNVDMRFYVGTSNVSTLGMALNGATGTVNIYSTMDAASTGSGSLALSGGMYVGKNIYFSTTASNGIRWGATKSVVAYAASAGQWLANAAMGDICICASANDGNSIRLGMTGAGNSTLDVLSSGMVVTNSTTDATSTTTGSFQTRGGVGIAQSLYVGSVMNQMGSTFTDTTTAASGTVTRWAYHSIAAPTLSASNPGVTTVDASTVYISGAPVPGIHQTIGNSWAMQVASGRVALQDTTDATSSTVGSLVLSGGLAIGKTLFAGSGSANQHIFQSNVASDAMGIQNLNLTGYSSIGLYDAGGRGQMSLGWSNASAGTEANSAFIFSNSDLHVDTVGSIYVSSSLDSVSLTSGAMVVNGGGAYGGTVSVGKTLTLYGATSGSASIQSPGTVPVPFTLTLPASLPSSDNQLLVSSATGALSWKSEFATTEMTRVNIGNNQVTPTDVVGMVYGGPQFSQYVLATVNGTLSVRALYLLEGVQQPSGAWDLNVTRNGSVDVGIQFSMTLAGQLQYVSSNVPGWTSTTLDFYSSTVNPATTLSDALSISNTADSASATTGALQVAGGVGITKNVTIGGGMVNLVNGGSNMIDFAPVGASPPSFSARSAGTKIVLCPSISASRVDYAIGMDTTTLWHSLPADDATNDYKWYGGTTVAMALDGMGNLAVSGKMTSPKFNVAQVMNNASGPYPVSATFTSNGGTLLFNCSLSSYASTSNVSGTFTFWIDGVAQHTYGVFSSLASVHTGCASCFVATGIAAGSHTLQITLAGGTSDGDDHVDVVVTEYPF